MKYRGRNINTGKFERLDIAFQLLIADISSRYVRVKEHELDEAINETLESIGKYCKVDRACIFRFSPAFTAMTNTYEWCAEGISSHIHDNRDIPVDSMPWWKNRITELKPVVISDVSDLPPEAAGEKAIFRRQGIQSILCLQMRSDTGNLIGFLGMDAVKNTRRWNLNETRLLQLVADLTGGLILRIEAQNALRASEEKYRTLTESIPGIIYRCLPDKNWTMLYMSGDINLLSGYPASDFIRNRVRSFASIIHREDEDFLAKTIENAMREGKPWEVEYRVINRDGRTRWVHERGRGVGTGKKTEYLDGVILDITSRKRAEEELSQSRQQLDMFFSQSMSGFHFMMLEKPLKWSDQSDKEKLIDYAVENLRMIRFNKAMLEQYGATEEDFHKLSLEDFFSFEKKQARETVREIFDNGRKHLISHERRFDNGKPVIIEGDYIALYDIKGMVTGFFGVQNDITFRILQEKKLQQANRAMEAALAHAEEMAEKAEVAMMVKNEFLANISHEIRTPMNGIMGMTDALLGTNLDEEQKGYAGLLESSAKLLMDLIHDILDFSKLNTGTLELYSVDFSLHDLFRELTLTMMPDASAKGLYLETVNDPGLPAYVRGDRIRLYQVLKNLLHNAIKFTSSGGIVMGVLESDNSQSADSSLPEHQNHCGTAEEFLSLPSEVKLYFYVKDTGIGISEDQKEKLFDRFSQVDGSFSRQYGGTGLGLAISKELVKIMGGLMGVKSKFGQGSEFWFTLNLEVAGTESGTGRDIGNNECVVGASKSDKPDAVTSSASVSRIRSIWNLESLRDRLMGEEKLVSFLAKEFLDQIITQINKTKDHIMNGNMIEANREAHSIHGAAANIGAEEMQDTASDIEVAARKGDREYAMKRIEDLEESYYRLQKRIEAFLDGQKR